MRARYVRLDSLEYDGPRLVVFILEKVEVHLQALALLSEIIVNYVHVQYIVHTVIHKNFGV